jgi:hypothetical protein
VLDLSCDVLIVSQIWKCQEACNPCCRLLVITLSSYLERHGFNSQTISQLFCWGYNDTPFHPSLQASTKMLLQNRPRSLIYMVDINSATQILSSIPNKFPFTYYQLHTICNTTFLSFAFTRLGQLSDSLLDYRLKTSLSRMYKHISCFLPEDDS